MKKPKILVLTDWFAPGYLAGGPIRSCVNFAYAMRSRFEIAVVTSDRDLGSETPYEGLARDQWVDFDEGIQVYYASPEGRSGKVIKQIILDQQAAYLYLNSMWSLPFTILPVWFKLRGQIEVPIIWAPRGMLKDEALRYKAYKKTPFLWLMKWFGVYKQVQFQATNEQEVLDIRKVIHPQADLVHVGNWPEARQKPWQALAKKPGEARWILIARIAWMKNLEFLFNLLREFPLPFRLDIWGPIEDPVYWKQCTDILEELPGHIDIQWQGQLPNEELRQKLLDYHFFILPTHGENFGHAIYEALQAGKPTLISDNTPWQQLREKEVGWDLSFENPQSWLEAITEAIEMDETTYHRWSKKSWQYAADYLAGSGLTEKYEQLFS